MNFEVPSANCRTVRRAISANSAKRCAPLRSWHAANNYTRQPVFAWARATKAREIFYFPFPKKSPGLIPSEITDGNAHCLTRAFASLRPQIYSPGSPHSVIYPNAKVRLAYGIYSRSSVEGDSIFPRNGGTTLPCDKVHR